MNILNSASKLVFLLLTVTTCIGFLLGRLDPDKFMMLTGLAFSFYFSNKNDNVERLPFNGK